METVQQKVNMSYGQLKTSKSSQQNMNPNRARRSWSEEDKVQDKEQVYSKIYAKAYSGQERYVVAEAMGVLGSSYRRQRRWVQENELRDLAGPMTLKQVNSLFSPVPFGEHIVSPFEEIMEPENQTAKSTFDKLLNVDMDIQGKAFKIWEKQAYSQKQGDSLQSVRAKAISQWKSIPQNLKTILKRVDIQLLEESEQELKQKILRSHSPGVAFLTWNNISSTKQLILQALCIYYKIKINKTQEEANDQSLTKSYSVQLYVKDKKLFEQQQGDMTFYEMLLIIKGDNESVQSS